MKKFTRAELVEHIVEKYKLHKAVVNEALETVFDDIKKALGDLRVVELRGFGTFEIHRRAGRRARNPKTGEKLITHDSNSVFFRPGKEMKNMVKYNPQEHPPDPGGESGL